MEGRAPIRARVSGLKRDGAFSGSFAAHGPAVKLPQKHGAATSCTNHMKMIPVNELLETIQVKP